MVLSLTELAEIVTQGSPKQNSPEWYTAQQCTSRANGEPTESKVPWAINRSHMQNISHKMARVGTYLLFQLASANRRAQRKEAAIWCVP